MLDRVTIERIAAEAGAGPILAALSGGGDSVALLYALTEAFPGRARALVVDHALREGSRADAESAVALAQAADVPVTIETLSWPGGANRAHEAARDARYTALCAAARTYGARVIATGHTRDDQAETVLLRATRGSGLRGLSGMRTLAPMPFWPEGRGLMLVRPLLTARRAALREGLRARGVSWIEDPANENVAYARVRMRGRLAELERQGFDPMRLAALAERLAPHADAIDVAAAALIAARARFEDDCVVLDGAAWLGDVEQRALAALLTAAGAHPRGPSARQVADLAAKLAAGEGGTLAGARAELRRGALVLSRDHGALVGRADGPAPIAPLPLSPGQTAIWDRRLALRMEAPGWSVVFEEGFAQLSCGHERLPLAVASPHWLLKERALHVLGQPRQDD